MDEMSRRQAFRREFVAAKGRGVDAATLELLQQMEKERTYIWGQVKKLEEEFGDQRQVLFGSDSDEDDFMRAFIKRHNYPPPRHQGPLSFGKRPQLEPETYRASRRL